MANYPEVFKKAKERFEAVLRESNPTGAKLEAWSGSIQLFIGKQKNEIMCFDIMLNYEEHIRVSLKYLKGNQKKSMTNRDKKLFPLVLEYVNVFVSILEEYYAAAGYKGFVLYYSDNYLDSKLAAYLLDNLKQNDSKEMRNLLEVHQVHILASKLGTETKDKMTHFQDAYKILTSVLDTNIHFKPTKDLRLLLNESVIVRYLGEEFELTLSDDFTSMVLRSPDNEIEIISLTRENLESMLEHKKEAWRLKTLLKSPDENFKGLIGHLSDVRELTKQSIVQHWLPDETLSPKYEQLEAEMGSWEGVETFCYTLLEKAKRMEYSFREYTFSARDGRHNNHFIYEFQDEGASVYFVFTHTKKGDSVDILLCDDGTDKKYKDFMCDLLLNHEPQRQ